MCARSMHCFRGYISDKSTICTEQFNIQNMHAGYYKKNLIFPLVNITV